MSAFPARHKTAAIVATALWAVSPWMKSSADPDRPQVRTPDGFVLRRTGGYNTMKSLRDKRAIVCVCESERAD
jgi:hypothetical protein